jgi:hypothetical protein
MFESKIAFQFRSLKVQAIMSIRSSRRRIAAYLHKALTHGVMPFLVFAAPALGGEGIDLNITNDGIDDIFVTVYDMTTEPHTTVMEHARINGFTKVPISATPDATGRANLSWSAISVDDRARKCGHEVRGGLDDTAVVSVHADSPCAGNRGSIQRTLR